MAVDPKANDDVKAFSNKLLQESADSGLSIDQVRQAMQMAMQAMGSQKVQPPTT